MKKSYIVLIVIGVILLGIVLWGVGSYNNIVSLETSVEESLANVSTNLKRRADLVPNLVSTVKGYASHEESVIKEVTDARAALSGAKTIDEMSSANDELSASLSKLLVIVENYPDLKASENFINLQDELAGTENRIATSRRDYNGAVRKYNNTIKKMPTNIIASLGNFEKAEYFTVSESDSEVPTVEF